ncbi:MAG: DUF2999 family protein [Shewanella sp.]
MNPIISLLKEHHISDTQINALFESLTANPFAAMATLGQLGIPADKLQQLMALVMQNPSLIKEAVVELGLDFAKVQAAQNQLQK